MPFFRYTAPLISRFRLSTASTLTSLLVAESTLVGCVGETNDPTGATTTATSASTSDISSSTGTSDGMTTAGLNGSGGNTQTTGYGYGDTASGTGGAIEVETVECEGPLPTDDVSGAVHAVTADASTSWGNLPHFWNSFGTGHLGLYLREQDAFGNLGSVLKEHTIDGVQNLGMKRIRSHGLFHDDIGIYSEDASGTPVFDFTKSDLIFDFLIEQGIVPIIELGPMPAALASDPSQTVFDWGLGISPPKDYAKWEALVRAFAAHYLERYGNEVVALWDWEVWNEPECCNGKFWTGGMEGYFELYDASVAGVRSVLPNARVGGPVTSQPSLLPDAGAQFLTHVTNNSQHLGFFAFHSWSFVGGSVGGYFEGLDLLDQFNFTDVRIMVTEFGPTWEFGLYDEPADMHQGAAFAVQTYSDISRRVAQEGKRWPISYSWWVLSDVFEEVMSDYRNDEPFIGCMGLISRQGIKKPAYNSYKFLSELGNEQLALSVEGAGDVGGMAARDAAGGVQIVLYNGQNPGGGPADDKYYDEAAAETIGVSLTGLDPLFTYDVQVYRVDADNGNAYKVWQDMGRPKMDAMTEQDWQSLRDNMESAPEEHAAAACGASYSETFSLSSPGVLFIKLEPAVR